MGHLSARPQLLLVTVCLIAPVLLNRAHGQSTAVAGAPQTATTTNAGSNQSTHPTTACPQEPCNAVPSRSGAPNPHTPRMIPPTEDQLLERRLLNVFGEIAGEQRYADATEKSGDPATAEAIRGRFARLSGFTSTDAERIKELGIQYCADIQLQHDKEVSTVLAVRRANPGVHMSRLNSPEIAQVQQERTVLWSTLKENLLQALGPRGFSKLDSYSRHMYDNAKTLSTTSPPASK